MTQVCGCPVTGTDGCSCGGDPSPVTNPPGLAEIAYRVNDFAGFRRALLAALPGEQQLSGWSPGPADLGVQIIEWWAYLADILTFYNERIANNDYLRTAAARPGPQQNVAGLVRLLGYLTQPGTTARGVVAAIRSASAPQEQLVIPGGMQIMSTPTASTPAQLFETEAAHFTGPSDVPIGLTPDPALFQPANPATTGSQPGQPGAAGVSAGAGVGHPEPTRAVLLAGRVKIQPGESLLLVPRVWDGTKGGWALATVSTTSTETDPDGTANTRVVLNSDGWNAIPGKPTADIYRLLKATATALLWTMPGASPPTKPPGTVWLATLVRGVAPGDIVLFTDAAAGFPILAQVTSYQEQVEAVTSTTGFSGGATTASSPPALIPHTTLTVSTSDPDTLADAVAANAGGIAMQYGFRDAGTLIPTPVASLTQLPKAVTVPPGTVLPSDGRVALADAAGTGLQVIASGPADGAVTLDPVAGASRSLDNRLQAPVRLLADLVNVSRGITVRDEILGDGDPTAASQAFILQHSPLVYLPPPQAGGAPVSTLSVTVDQVAWSEVTAFARQPKDATVYVVRRLADGRSQVCFGDGWSGARLPPGTGNVTATYRYSPPGGPPPAGRLSTVLQPQPHLAAIRSPVALEPGTDPESAAQTAEGAPSTVVLLAAAAISAGDCEQLATTVDGVTRVRAYWAWDTGRRLPAITLYVDDAAAVKTVQGLLPAATSRLPVTVRQARPAYLIIRCELARASGDPGAGDDAITGAAASALTGTTGLFSAGRMAIGQRLYPSQVETALAVASVRAVLGLRIEPAPEDGTGSGPAAARRDGSGLDPGPGRYFQVRKDDLHLSVVPHG